MSNIIKNDFSISGQLAFNPEDNCNYVVVGNSSGKMKTSNTVPNFFSSRETVRNKEQNYENSFKFVKLKKVAKDSESKFSSVRSAIGPITNEKIPRDHDYFNPPTKLVKLRSTQDTTHRVKLRVIIAVVIEDRSNSNAIKILSKWLFSCFLVCIFKAVSSSSQVHT